MSEVLKRTTEMWDFLFKELFDEREITESDRDDHCEGDTDY